MVIIIIIIIIRIVHEVHNKRASKHRMTIKYYTLEHSAKKEKRTQFKSD